MIKILLIIPYTEIKSLCEQLVEKINIPGVSLELAQIFMQDDTLLRNCDADIIIARGLTGQTIRRYNLQIHLVDIKVGITEIIDAIAKCRRIYQCDSLAIIQPAPFISNLESLEELTCMKILQYTATTEEEISSKLLEARSQGICTFIGGKMMCLQCEQSGLNSIHVQTGASAIDQAIQEAIGIASAISQNIAQTNLQRNILNSVKDSVLVLDMEGIIIEANKQVYESFHLAGNLIGKPISSICPELDWKESLATGLEMESIHKIKGDFVLADCKPINIGHRAPRIIITFQNASNIRESDTKIRKQLASKGLTSKYNFGDIIGSSGLMQQCINMACRYSRTDSNVLITGESGTGKELFAHSIHNASRRKNQPFVAVNCAALPETLLESELFGYASGAFSGADKNGKSGLFELAHKGTIFLDEIGEMPINLQAKLLRVLQEKEIRRVGDDCIIPVDVRVISATNIHIQQIIAEKKFRSDLYYRINLLQISLPPLRERREDILQLCEYFIARHARTYDIDPPRLSKDAQSALLSYFWPGNTRELQNICERIVVLSTQPVVTPEEFRSMNLFDIPLGQTGYLNQEEPPSNASKLTQEDLAALMGISRTTLWRRRKKQN